MPTGPPEKWTGPKAASGPAHPAAEKLSQSVRHPLAARSVSHRSSSDPVGATRVRTTAGSWGPWASPVPQSNYVMVS